MGQGEREQVWGQGRDGQGVALALWLAHCAWDMNKGKVAPPGDRGPI